VSFLGEKVRVIDRGVHCLMPSAHDASFSCEELVRET